MGILMAANSQWSRRPADERFGSVMELYKACLAFKSAAVSAVCDLSSLFTVAEGEQVRIADRDAGGSAALTDWSFRQVCRYAGAPAEYMQTLPPALATECLNDGIRRTAERGGIVRITVPSKGGKGVEEEIEVGRQAKLLFTQEGADGSAMRLRSMTGTGYCRIWNADIAKRLLDLHEQHGWRVPPARPARADQPGARKATKEDILASGRGPKAGGIQIREGDLIAPAGLYASDHDMFAFLVNEDRPIDDGSDGGLHRGMFVSNSETGGGAFKVTRFLYRSVCGNHIVWDASGVSEVNIRHVGIADERGFAELAMTLKQYADGSAKEEEARIKKLQTLRMGANIDDVVAACLGLRIPGLSQKSLRAAYVSTEKLGGVDGDPATAWGMAQGITRISQDSLWADDRVVLDRAAGMVLAKVGK